MLRRNLLLGLGFRVAVSHNKQMVVCFYSLPQDERKLATRLLRRDPNYEVAVLSTDGWIMKRRISFRPSKETSFGYGAQLGALFSPDDSRLLVFDHGRYELYDLRKGRLLAGFRTGLRTSPVRFSPCGQSLVLIVNDNELRLIDATTGEVQHQYDLPGSSLIFDLATSADSNVMALLDAPMLVSDEDVLEGHVLMQRSPRPFELVKLPLDFVHHPLGLDLSPDALRLAVYSASTVDIYSCLTSQLLRSIDGLEYLPSSVCWTPSGYLTYTVGDRVSVLDAELRPVEVLITTDQDCLPRDGVEPPWARLLRYC